MALCLVTRSRLIPVLRARQERETWRNVLIVSAVFSGTVEPGTGNHYGVKTHFAKRGAITPNSLVWHVDFEPCSCGECPMAGADHSRRATAHRRPCEPDLAGAADEPRYWRIYRDCGRQNPIRRENLEVWKTTVFPRYLMDITQDLKDRESVLVPAAESQYPQQRATDGAAIRSRDVSRQAPHACFRSLARRRLSKLRA